MERTTRTSLSRRAFRGFALLVVLGGSICLGAAPMVAQAAAAASVCSKVSAASVSAIVGYTVPAATISTRTVKATPQNHGISAVDTMCTFGSGSTVAALLKDVTLEVETTSRPITLSEVLQSLDGLSTASLKFKATSYAGLGVPAVYFTETGSGITGQGISEIVGKKIFGASLEQPLSEAKLASLTKLAATL